MGYKCDRVRGEEDVGSAEDDDVETEVRYFGTKISGR